MVEIVRNRIKFNCPKCQTRLSAKLDKAGQLDTCPDCNAQFVTPGEDALRQRNAERQQAKDAREAAALKRQQEKAERRKAKQEKPKPPAVPNTPSKPLKAKQGITRGDMRQRRITLITLRLATLAAFAVGFAVCAPMISNASAAEYPSLAAVVISAVIAVSAGFAAASIPYTAIVALKTLFQIEANTRKS